MGLISKSWLNFQARLGFIKAHLTNDAKPMWKLQLTRTDKHFKKRKWFSHGIYSTYKKKLNWTSTPLIAQSFNLQVEKMCNLHTHKRTLCWHHSVMVRPQLSLPGASSWYRKPKKIPSKMVYWDCLTKSSNKYSPIPKVR